MTPTRPIAPADTAQESARTLLAGLALSITPDEARVAELRAGGGE